MQCDPGKYFDDKIFIITKQMNIYCRLAIKSYDNVTGLIAFLKQLKVILDNIHY